MKNGNLLRSAEAEGFEVFLTGDQHSRMRKAYWLFQVQSQGQSLPSGDSLSIGVFTVADAGDLNGVFAFSLEEEAVVAAAEPEVRTRGFQLLDVTGAACQLAVQAVKNLHGSLTVYGAKIGSSFL